MAANADRERSMPPDRVELSVSNIGGIERTRVAFERGVTVLSGRNATNRTSLLQGIMAALGSDRASLKADATEGEAVLEADERYRRTLRRNGDSVTSDGDPYLDDASVADLFAFLLESNELRRAVASGEDLREWIMRPVDTASIERDIDRLERRKREIDSQLADLEGLDAERSDLQSRRRRLSEDIDALREELAEQRGALDDAEFDPREAQSELAETIDDLQDARSDLERCRERIETERESVAALEDERASVREQLESLPESAREETEDLEAELDALRDRKAALDEEISRLQSTIQFNRERLDGDAVTSDDSLFDGDAELTEELLPSGDRLWCWSCGSVVDREQIESTVDQLRELRGAKLEQRNGIEAEIEEVVDRREKRRQRREERERAEERLDSIESELDRRRRRVSELTDERETLAATVEELESAVGDLEATDHEELLDRQKRLSRLSVRIEEKERERDEIDDELDAIEDRIDRRESLAAERESVAEELTELRTRIDRIEADAVEAFNEHMETLLDVLEYENVARIWIDRSGANHAEDGGSSSFELKIVRTTAEGTAYQDSIDHLSESEREVTGLVFALAGYLVHDVHETVPFMLLDSLEAIDAERIAALVEYFADFVPFLVVALLEEDAAPLAEDHDVITEI